MKETNVKPKYGKMPFNLWSRQKIREGQKVCTSRTRLWVDERVRYVIRLPLFVVRDYLYTQEGADSPQEFEKVWRSIFRGKFPLNRMVWVHFGDFKEKS